MLFMGLEALPAHRQHQVTKQITKRRPMLADEVGIEGISRNFARRMYEDRSSPAHGQELRLPAARSGRSNDRGRLGERPNLEPDYLAEVVLVQDLLRAATRKAIEDPAFGSVFTTSSRFAHGSPVTTLIGNSPVEVAVTYAS